MSDEVKDVYDEIQESHKKRSEEIHYMREREKTEKIDKIRGFFERANAVLKEVENINDVDLPKAPEIITSTNWFTSFFSKIFSYFFGDKKSKKKEIDNALNPEKKSDEKEAAFDVINSTNLEELTAYINKTKAAINSSLEELKKKPETKESKKAMESLNNLNKELSDDGAIGEIKNAFEDAAEKENPGALGGEDLKNELKNSLKIFLAINEKYEGLTGTIYFQKITMNIMKSVGQKGTAYNLDDVNALDFNSPEKVKAFLVDLKGTLDNYGEKREGCGDILQADFRSELVNSLGYMIGVKLEAIEKNEKLVANGKPPIKYEPRNLITSELAQKWYDYTNELETMKAENEQLKLSIYEKINERRISIVNKLEKDLQNGAKETEIKEDVKKLMHICRIYNDRKTKFDGELTSQINDYDKIKGSEEYTKEAESFLNSKMYKNVKNELGKKTFLENIFNSVKEYYDRKELLSDFNKSYEYLLQAIRTDVNNKEPDEKLMLDAQALVILSEVVNNADNIETAALFAMRKREALEEGMKQIKDSIRPDFIDKLRETVKESEANSPDGKKVGNLKKAIIGLLDPSAEKNANVEQKEAEKNNGKTALI